MLPLWRDSRRYFATAGTTKAITARIRNTRKLGCSWLVLNRVCKTLLIELCLSGPGGTAQKRWGHSQMLPFSSGFMGAAMTASTMVMAAEKPVQKVARYSTPKTGRLA